MVATHSQPRRSSNTSNGGSSHTNSRSRRRSSLRRQSEKLSNSIISSTAAAPTTSTTSLPTTRGHHGRRSQSVSAGSHHHYQQQNNRRPSAPAVVEMPRLSIADRFMSGNCNNATAAPPPVPTPTIPQRSASPSISNRSNSIALSNSASSDIPSTGSNSRLSVADRFMNSDSLSSPTNSTLTLSGIQQYRERSGSSFSGRTTTRASSIIPNTSTITAASDPVSGRLTIANAFMKSSSTLTPTVNDESRSRAASFGELDLGVINGNVQNRYSKPSPDTTQQQIHPLEERPTTTSLFDDTQYHLNLNLNLSPTSPASSLIINNKINSRPWGSQDTLVQHHSTERKKPIYAQFIESEKNATLFSDNRSFVGGGDYDYSSPDNYHDKRTMMSDDHSTKLGDYDEYDDIEIGVGGGNNKYYGRHDRQWSYDEEDEEKSSGGYHQESPDASTTTKLKKIQQNHNDDDDEYNTTTTRGFWVGCCFISCGQRPSRKTIEQRQKQKQRREKENNKDEDVKRSKNRGFGRRGWVFCTFISLVIVVLITSFLWPRTPLMRIEGASLISAAKITETRQGVMVGNVAFGSEWLVNITVDNRQNHVPTRLVQVQVLAKDALTGLVIGKGLHNDDPNPEHIVLAPNTISTIQIPIRVDYQARDSTDTTFVDLTKACLPQQQVNALNSSPNNSASPNQREALPLHFWITLHFFGLDWLNYKPTVIATPATGGFACPQS